MACASRSVTFVLPHFASHPVGGVKVVFQYAQQLAHWGCHVTICFDCSETLKERHLPESLRRQACRAFVARCPRWFPLDRRIDKRCVFSVDDSTVPAGTDVVATAIETVPSVAALGPAAGRKHYLIQGFETWVVPEAEVRRTYRLGMSNIVVSDWLERLVAQEAGVPPTLIKNAIDPRDFHPEPGVARRAHEVAVLYHTAPHKGFADVYAALRLARSQVPDLVVNAFGVHWRPRWMPGWFRYTRDATPAQLRRIYTRSAVFAYGATNEGFALTPPEAMFCGCALASSDFAGVWEYADRSCALISAPHDSVGLAASIVALLEDPAGCARMAAAGRRHAMGECSVERARAALRREFRVGDAD